MTPERIAELRGTVAAIRDPFCDGSPLRLAGFLGEALDEIDRLNKLIATRPVRHRIRLNTDEWHCAHPIGCNPVTCRTVTHEIASMLREEYGPDVTVELTDDDEWVVVA